MTSSQFQKGRSGNPKGRPKAKPVVHASAFDIVMDRTLTVVQGGQERELTIEEALQLKTYQDAIGGSRMAQREILKMIKKREKAMGSLTPVQTGAAVRFERGDPRNADKAMLLLGIAQSCDTPYPSLKLKGWAVEAALRALSEQMHQGPSSLLFRRRQSYFARLVAAFSLVFSRTTDACCPKSGSRRGRARSGHFALTTPSERLTSK